MSQLITKFAHRNLQNADCTCKSLKLATILTFDKSPLHMQLGNIDQEYLWICSSFMFIRTWLDKRGRTWKTNKQWDIHRFVVDGGRKPHPWPRSWSSEEKLERGRRVVFGRHWSYPHLQLLQSLFKNQSYKILYLQTSFAEEIMKMFAMGRLQMNNTLYAKSWCNTT